VIADESLPPPPPLSTSFPLPPDRGGVSTNGSPTLPSQPREGRQEQTTWWNYVSWTSSTKGGPGSEKDNVNPAVLDEAGPGASASSTSDPLLTSPPLPPLVPFPLGDPQTTLTTTSVGLSLLNNIHTISGPESTESTSKSRGTSTTDAPESTGKAIPESPIKDTHKPSGEGGWYDYVPAPWSWGSAGPASTSVVGSAVVTGVHGGEEVADPPSGVDSAAMGGEERREVTSEPDSDSRKGEVSLITVDSQPSSSDEGSNPLTTLFQRDTPTWASFLRTSRRMLTVKRVTDGVADEGVDEGVKRDENGVEVMDVDFEEEGVDDDSSKVEAKEGDGKVALPLHFVSGGEGDKGDGSNANTKNGGSRSVSTSFGAGGLASRIWTSTTTSTTTMITTNKTNHPSRSPTPSRMASRTALDSQGSSRASTPSNRHASPAPSKQSISTKSKPPNMVLPKWEETFLSAPRSVVSAGVRARMERQRSREGRKSVTGEGTMLGRGAGGEEGIGGKILGRTVKFVSGLLGAVPVGVGPVAEGKGVGAGLSGGQDTTNEVERRLGEFGQDLPKAWKVLEGVNGNGLEPGVLKGCKKVVVIGVHGWFPGAIVRTVLGEVRLPFLIFL